METEREQLKKLELMEAAAAAVAAEEETMMAPVSPESLYLKSSVLSIYILAVFESSVPIDDSLTIRNLNNDFLPINSRFSSIMVKDEHGIQRWKEVKVKLEDHVTVPVFPPGLPSYDDCVHDYISGLALRELPSTQPLWEFHIIKYPTNGGAVPGCVVFKLHHALGDGFSLMGALFSCARRADDPSLPLTYPAAARDAKEAPGGGAGCCRRIPRALAVCKNTIQDFSWSIWKSSLVADDLNPVRSGIPGVEHLPLTVESVEFSLEEIQKIKIKIGGTINDVICGAIFYGMRLYIHAMSSSHENNEEKKYAKDQKKKKKKGSSMSSSSSSSSGLAKVTSLILLNTRMLGFNYKSIQEMAKPESKAPWGNHFAFLLIPVPKCKNPKEADPLQFVYKARKIINARKSSLGVILTAYLIEFIRKIRGPEVAARYIYKTLTNTSTAIINLVGPKEQMMIAGHPCKSFHFIIAGAPQSLTTTMVSYVGKLKVTFAAEKGFIDTQLLISAVQESFHKISQAAASI